MQVLRAVAIVLTALAFVPGGAHIFELPNKIGLARDAYFTVQQIYRGWAFFGVVFFAALGANAGLAVLLWRHGGRCWPPVVASVAIAASLAVFFIWVYPGNLATANWTTAPADWETLRARWEFGHMAAAALVFIGLCAVSLTRIGSDRPLGPQRGDL
jgi:hypothetical protein